MTDYTLLDAAPVVRADAGMTAPSATGEILPPLTLDAGSSPAPGAPTPSTPMTPVTPRDAAAPSAPAQKDAGADSGTMDSGSAPPTPTPAVDSGSATLPPVDAGSAQPDAGAGGQVCAAAPSYPTTTSCAQCTCAKCASGVSACYGNAQCAAIRRCAETSRCTGEACFCGESLLCLSPEGPCRSEIQAAAGSDSPLDVRTQSEDPSTPIGRSLALGECQLANCRSECGL